MCLPASPAGHPAASLQLRVHASQADARGFGRPCRCMITPSQVIVVQCSITDMGASQMHPPLRTDQLTTLSELTHTGRGMCVCILGNLQS